MRVVTAFALTLCAGLPAQSMLTSPEAAGDVDGISNSAYPFSAASSRFQQTMSDLKGTPRAFKSLSLRPDQGYACSECAARTIEVQITMAHTDITKTTTTFASNYIGTPTIVFPRTKVSLPARKGPYSKLPTPDFTFTFAKPFLYDGKQDFLIDIQTWNGSSTANYYTDYASSRVYADRTNIGTGCTATGQSNAMSLVSYCSSQLDTNGKSAFRFYWSASNGVANAPAVIFAGLTNPNLAVSGLCTNLYTDLGLALAMTADANGAFSIIFYAPFDVAWVGGVVYAQAMSVDTGRTSGWPLSLSNGVSSKLRGRFAPAKRVQHFSDGSATTGAGPYSNQLVVMFGI